MLLVVVLYLILLDAEVRSRTIGTSHMGPPLKYVLLQTRKVPSGLPH